LKMNLTNLLLLAFVIITWGYSWVLMKQALDFMMPLTFVALRITVGGLFILPLILRSGSFKFSNFFKMEYLVLGLLQTTAMFGFIIYGMKFVTAGKTAVVLYTMPVWTSFLLHFFLKERLSARQWVGVVFGIIGILSILGWDTLIHQNRLIVLGECLILLAAVSWAVANIWIRVRLKSDNPTLLNGYQQLIGVVFLIVLAVSTEGFFRVEWTYYSLYTILFTGIVASAVNFSAWFYLINKIDINITTYSSLLVPVFGLFFDWLILDTKLDIGLIIGGFFIILGIIKISRK
ncbi:MAG: DMT family transporter, partial [Thermodesulfobacteriota bacterium]